MGSECQSLNLLKRLFRLRGHRYSCLFSFGTGVPIELSFFFRCARIPSEVDHVTPGNLPSSYFDITKHFLGFSFMFIVFKPSNVSAISARRPVSSLLLITISSTFLKSMHILQDPSHFLTKTGLEIYVGYIGSGRNYPALTPIDYFFGDCLLAFFWGSEALESIFLPMGPFWSGKNWVDYYLCSVTIHALSSWAFSSLSLLLLSFSAIPQSVFVSSRSTVAIPLGSWGICSLNRLVEGMACSIFRTGLPSIILFSKQCLSEHDFHCCGPFVHLDPPQEVSFDSVRLSVVRRASSVIIDGKRSGRVHPRTPFAFAAFRFLFLEERERLTIFKCPSARRYLSGSPVLNGFATGLGGGRCSCVSVASISLGHFVKESNDSTGTGIPIGRPSGNLFSGLFIDRLGRLFPGRVKGQRCYGRLAEPLPEKIIDDECLVISPGRLPPFSMILARKAFEPPPGWTPIPISWGVFAENIRHHTGMGHSPEFAAPTKRFKWSAGSVDPLYNAMLVGMLYSGPENSIILRV
ncbi:hypothetical protein Tco_0638105 [Tanacetum coccineum]